MTVDQAMAIKNTQIVEELNLPPVKIHCSVLAEDAIKARSPTTRRSARRRTGTGTPDEHPREQRRQRKRRWPLQSADRAVAEIKKAAGAARDAPEGAARRHPRRRLHGLLLPVRVVGSGAARRGQGAGVRGRRRARVRRSQELRLPRRHDAGLRDHDDGPRASSSRTRTSRGRAAAARASSSRRVMICWSCEKEAGGGAALRGVRGAAAARRRGGSVRGARAAARVTRSIWRRLEARLQGSVAAGAPRSLSRPPIRARGARRSRARCS